MEEKKETKVEIESSNLPWTLTDTDKENIKDLKIKPEPVDQEQIEKIKKDCPSLDALMSYYYQMKHNLSKMMSEEASKIDNVKSKDLSLRMDFLLNFVKITSKFLYGEYKNEVDRELPSEKAKLSDKTQGEFFDFMTTVEKTYLDNIKENYKSEMSRFAKEGIISETKLKILFTTYYNEIYKKNEVNEKDMK